MSGKTKPRFQDRDLVRIKDDDVVGIVVGFGVAVADDTPERLMVKIGDDDIREVYAESCEKVSAINQNAVSAASEEGATLVSGGSSDVTIKRDGDTVKTSRDDELTEAELDAITRPVAGTATN